jgi:hypothetical protein
VETRGAWALWRAGGRSGRVRHRSFWESREPIEGFAGQDIEKAVFYRGDDRFLVERDLAVRHNEVADAE